MTNLLWRSFLIKRCGGITGRWLNCSPKGCAVRQQPGEAKNEKQNNAGDERSRDSGRGRKEAIGWSGVAVDSCRNSADDQTHAPPYQVQAKQRFRTTRHRFVVIRVVRDSLVCRQPSVQITENCRRKIRKILFNCNKILFDLFYFELIQHRCKKI